MKFALTALCITLASALTAQAQTTLRIRGSDTLGAWTSRDRPIGNRDIVAWYTVGFHHIPRMEDWPVMPTHWFGFTLMPHNFFASNPAMTIREPK